MVSFQSSIYRGRRGVDIRVKMATLPRLIRLLTYFLCSRYDIGVIAGALGQITSEFSLGDIQQGLVVSFIYLGASFGCLWGGNLADRVGRRNTIHVQNLIFILGAIAIVFSTNIATLYVGRFIVGIAAALSGIAGFVGTNLKLSFR